MKITRDVVSDLWPLVACGEASADTRALVDEFLRGEPEFARNLSAPAVLPPVTADLPPEAEARALTRTRNLVHGGSWLRGLRLTALALSGLAFARLIEDGSLETMRRPAATAAAAVVVWVLYFLLLHRYRARTLGKSG